MKGMGFARVFGLVGLMIVAAIVAVLYLRDGSASVQAKKSAERTLEDVREIMDSQQSIHQRALNDARRGLGQREQDARRDHK